MNNTELALVLAGPILRRIEQQRVTIWLATSQPLSIRLSFYSEHHSTIELSQEMLASSICTIAAGERLYYHLLDIKLAQPLPLETWIGRH